MNRTRSVGIRDLARELQMSISTVSRAMNSRGEVSAETRALVVSTAERIGYTPNQSGRSLRHGTTDTVALVMPTSTARTESGETFFLNISDALQEVLSPAGLNLTILPYGSSENRENFLIKVVDRHLADAVILADTQIVDPRIDYLLQRKVPFVSLGRTRAGGHSWLDLDVENAARQSVDRLVLLGHRRIALGRSDRQVNSTALFVEAYRHRLEDHGIEYDPALILPVSDHRGGGFDLGTKLLEMADCPTAIMLELETLAIGLYSRLRESGREPGIDIAVTGFRINPVLELLSPALTAFEFDLRGYGHMLGGLVLAELANAGGSPLLACELWPMQLLIGESDHPPIRIFGE